jgi:ribosomal protein S12 methylthiotransferase
MDQYFGTTELPALLKALGADYKHELLGERLTTTPKRILKFRRLRQTL